MSAPKTPKDPQSNSDVLARFRTHLISNGKSPQTIRQYLYVTRRFLAALEVPIDQAGVREVEDFLVDVVESYEGSGRPQAAVVGYALAIKSLYRSLGRPIDDTFPKGERRHTEPRVLPSEDILRLLEGAKANSRTYAILQVLAFSGLRVSEVAALRPRDVNPDARTLFVNRGKESKDRTVVAIPPSVFDAISRWLLEAALSPSPHRTLFGVSSRSIEENVRDVALSVGLPDWVSPHTLRHSYLTELFRRGIDMPLIQRQAGHASVATTQVYVHIANDDVRDRILTVSGDLYSPVADPTSGEPVATRTGSRPGEDSESPRRRRDEQHPSVSHS